MFFLECVEEIILISILSVSPNLQPSSKTWGGCGFKSLYGKERLVVFVMCVALVLVGCSAFNGVQETSHVAFHLLSEGACLPVL